MNIATAKGLTQFALRDLQGSRAMRSLWVFCASLVLGITLVSACGNLLQLVKQGFGTQQRYLFGGDLQISQREPLSETQKLWIEANAQVSQLMELRTMLGNEAGDFTVVELQSVDQAYPLYGEVRLSPDITLQQAVSQSAEGIWGAAFDPVLADQLDLEVGQSVTIGNLNVELRAVIIQQPDRSLRADVRGPPVIIDQAALASSGLLLPTSLVDYDYRVRTTEVPDAWRSRLREAFPEASWEVQTVAERGDLIAQRLDQVASVLLLIGFSTLFIGGLGVSNSISAYLQTKFRTLATLQSLGCRDAHVAFVFIGQVAFLGAMASAAGAVTGAAIAWLTAFSLSTQLPIDTHAARLWWPTVLSIVFGTLTALLFALPMLGRTLTSSTAQLIKGLFSASLPIPRHYRSAIVINFFLLVSLLLVLIPEPVVGLLFILILSAILFCLQALVRLIQAATQSLARVSWLDSRVALRLACANLSRENSSLRPMLLSLGTSLTILVTAALVIAATLNTLNSTVPARAPSLVFYDLQDAQVDEFEQLNRNLDGFEDLAIAPLVLGRLTGVNGESLSDSDNAQRALEANDEHKLSYRIPGVDNTQLDRGNWWPPEYAGPALVAMEDREADQLGLQVGDSLTFTILGEPINATLAAIYSQARFETSFWLEAVFSNGSLDPFITRHIGSIRYTTGTDSAAMSQLAGDFPNVVIIPTSKVLATARSILSGASLGIIAIAAVSLAASVLVMASVVAVSRQRQIYEASIMHAVGTRMRVIMQSVGYEYLLLACVLTLFATLVGSVMAWAMLNFWLKLPITGIWTMAVLVAATVSAACLFSGAFWLLKSLSASPAMLLKRAS